MVCEYMLSRSPFISRLAVYNPNEPDPSSTRIDITYKEEILSSESGVINYGDTEIQVKCTPMSSSKIDDSKRIPYNFTFCEVTEWSKKYSTRRKAELETIKYVRELIDKLELDNEYCRIFVNYPNKQRRQFNNKNFDGIMNDGEIEYSKHMTDIKWLINKTEETLSNIIEGKPTGHDHLFGRNYLL